MLQAQDLFAVLDPEEQIVQSEAVTQELVQATTPQNLSLLPNDLQSSTRVLSDVVKVLENNNLTNEAV